MRLYIDAGENAPTPPPPRPNFVKCLGHIPVAWRFPGQDTGVTGSAGALFIARATGPWCFSWKVQVQHLAGETESLAIVVSCPLLRFSSWRLSGNQDKEVFPTSSVVTNPARQPLLSHPASPYFPFLNTQHWFAHSTCCLQIIDKSSFSA